MRALIFFSLAAALCPPTAAQAVASSGVPAALRSDCAAGSHAVASGACRADVSQIDRYCPAGTIYQPGREGWTCVTFALPGE